MYSYICGIMKKILFFLSIAFAIFSPNTLCAHDTELQSGCNITEHEYAFDSGQSNSDNLLFDVCFEDLCDDDSNDSVRKKDSSGKTPHSYAAFFVQNLSDHFFTKVLYTKFFSQCRTPLFIYINVFRL